MLMARGVTSPELMAYKLVVDLCGQRKVTGGYAPLASPSCSCIYGFNPQLGAVIAQQLIL